MKALTFEDLDRLSIRTGCETETNRAADLELCRRGYVFNASEQRWIKSAPDPAVGTPPSADDQTETMIEMPATVFARDYVHRSDFTTVQAELTRLRAENEALKKHRENFFGVAYRRDLETRAEAAETEVARLRAERDELKAFVDRCHELGATDTDIVKHALEDQARIREEFAPLSMRYTALLIDLRALERFNIAGRYGGQYTSTTAKNGDWIRAKDLFARLSREPHQDNK